MGKKYVDLAKPKSGALFYILGRSPGSIYLKQYGLQSII